MGITWTKAWAAVDDGAILKGVDLKNLQDDIDDFLNNEAGFFDRGDPTAVDFAVGDLTTDSTWNDLDLSSIIDAGAVAVVLSVTIEDGATESTLDFRKNGNSNAIAIASISTQVVDVPCSSTLTVALDSNGVIEYRGSNLTFSTINITVLGWWF
jgi:hypothetical protein